MEQYKSAYLSSYRRRYKLFRRQHTDILLPRIFANGSVLKLLSYHSFRRRFCKSGSQRGFRKRREPRSNGKSQKERTGFRENMLRKFCDDDKLHSAFCKSHKSVYIVVDRAGKMLRNSRNCGYNSLFLYVVYT